MARSGARSALVLSGLGIVFLGAVALAGWAHPNAPTGESLSYLPAISLPTVIVAAAVDGINPCAFTVLLLLVTALLATVQSDSTNLSEVRARILARGGVFVAAIFLTYLALGVGVMGTMGLFTRQHWPARIGALVAVLFGLWMMKDYFLPDAGWRLRAPSRVGEIARAAARKGTMPALLGGGVLIGICTVPCSGAVYLAVLSLLALQPSRAVGFGYLLLYNVIFVLPLLLLLGIAASRPSLRRMATWNLRHGNLVRLILGGSVVVGGLLILATV
ncbi:MAG: cytochrome c biogenesis CcdA family protein [Longimicrobiales bacterium]